MEKKIKSSGQKEQGEEKKILLFALLFATTKQQFGVIIIFANKNIYIYKITTTTKLNKLKLTN